MNVKVMFCFLADLCHAHIADVGSKHANCVDQHAKFCTFN